ncbi:hypothetical protein GL213_12370 [Halogeometricum borinquense]|uniref:Uncharacterized protein n=1 Tax=Halogeometricum borinquense TaxID=60847 RepID=A0A6C0UBY2_9EURY|nr:hypothetical protein [Halogeometricum borinquense]QIB72786.1 hypothetical protein G3I44_03060 [Halogeometricum borinquense]QIQ75066.1 hypothetical protein GL213_12370 [Halogeometricum borinquense]
MPLFPDLPGGPELLCINLLFAVGPGLFVYYNSTENNVENRLLWTGATLAAGLVANIVGSGVVLLL